MGTIGFRGAQFKKTTHHAKAYFRNRRRTRQGQFLADHRRDRAAAGDGGGRYFRTDKQEHRVVIGKDTRLSGYMLENALTAGFTSTGMNVLLLGPVPTPAVGYLTHSLRADVGVMLSASHTPAHDNGIKFFDPDGYKHLGCRRGQDQ